MSIETFIQAMPKAELHIHLEGGVNREQLVLIAEQNDIPETLKHFNTWAGLLDKPDYDRLDEIVRVAAKWLRIPEDLTRVAYDLATSLAKQNVRYAEITVNPALYPDMNLTLEQFVAAINDGRERARRAWGINIAWILAIPREEPRKADDFVRFAQTVAARRSGVAGIGLMGKESSQPIGQFERAFQGAEKKALPRIPHAGEMQGADGVIKTVNALLPNRVADAWGIATSEEALRLLTEKQVAVDVSMARALRLKKIASIADYPLRKLYDEGIVLTIGSDMPIFFKMTLNDQYLALVKQLGFEQRELEELALNAVRVSLLPDDEKQALDDEFRQAYETLRAEHLAPQAT